MRIEPFTDITHRDRPAAADRSARAAAAADDTLYLSTTGIPAVPPSEVLEQIAAADRRHDELVAAGRGLSYEVDPQTGALRVEVRDASGAVTGELSASAALDVVLGAEPA